MFKNTSLLASVYVAVQACYLCSFPTATVGIELVVNVVLRHFKPFPYFLVTRHISPLSRKPKFERLPINWSKLVELNLVTQECRSTITLSYTRDCFNWFLQLNGLPAKTNAKRYDRVRCEEGNHVVAVALVSALESCINERISVWKSIKEHSKKATELIQVLYLVCCLANVSHFRTIQTHVIVDAKS